MEKIRNSSVLAADYLMAIPLGYWVRHAFDSTPKIDPCTNNCNESFSAWVELIRGYSIMNIMEGLRKQVTQSIVVRERIVTLFVFMVNLQTRSCDCMRWDLSGIPYGHAWVAINHSREDGENFLGENHTKATYQRSYDMIIQPVPHHIFWPGNLTQDECSPRDVQRKLGSPIAGRNIHASEPRKRKTPVEKTNKATQV